MQKIVLDKRLQAVYDEILPCKCLVDIGTDHGKIPIKAVIEKKCEYAIAGDISKPSLEKAERLAQKHNIANLVFCRHGNGLEVAQSDDNDTLIIAGMGGLEIINILSASSIKFDKYILLPHRNAMQLRIYLSENEICCDKDYMIECNGKYYNLITAKQGKYMPSNAELKYGKSRKTPIFRAFLLKEMQKIANTLQKALAEDTKKEMEIRYKELKDMYESIADS